MCLTEFFKKQSKDLQSCLPIQLFANVCNLTCKFLRKCPFASKLQQTFGWRGVANIDLFFQIHRYLTS